MNASSLWISIVVVPHKLPGKSKGIFLELFCGGARLVQAAQSQGFLLDSFERREKVIAMPQLPKATWQWGWTSCRAWT